MSHQEVQSNVHDPRFREAKQPQGGASVAVADLFRLDKRTIIGKGLNKESDKKEGNRPI